MKLIVCKHCESEFDTQDRRKQLAGGYINECPDCVEERGGDASPPKYLGVNAGDGKMSSISILKFKSEQDRAAYAKMWKNNSGGNIGKSCQLGTHLTGSLGISFETVQTTGPMNHKGRL